MVEKADENQARVDAIMAAADNEEEALEAVFVISSEPLAAFASDLAKANPPADVEEFHEGFVETFQTLAEQLKGGDVAALDASGSAFETLEIDRAGPGPSERCRSQRSRVRGRRIL